MPEARLQRTREAYTPDWLHESICVRSFHLIETPQTAWFATPCIADLKVVSYAHPDIDESKK